MAFALVAQAPTQPTAPSISASAPGSNSLNIALNSPSVEPVYGVGGYNINVAANGGSYVRIASNIPQSSFPYNWSGASSSTPYQVKVNGVDLSPNRVISPDSNIASATTSGASSGLPFPRLWVHAGGGTRDYYGSTLRTYFKCFNGVTLNAWDGWSAGKPMNIAQVTDDIKAGSLWSSGTLVVHYYNAYTISPSIQNYSVLSGANFLLRETSPSGPLVTRNTTFNVGWFSAGGPTLGGRTCQQYFTDYVLDYQYNGGAAGLAVFSNPVNPNLDGTWWDDLQFELQNGHGDWLRTGVDNLDSPAASAAMRAGWSFMWGRFNSAKPTKLRMANVSQIASHSTPSERAELAGILDGGGQEGMLGQTFCVESFSTWDASMTSYINEVAFTKDKEKNYFMHACLTTNGQDFYRNVSPWQAVRYGLAYCLMYDSAYCPCPNGVTGTPTTSSGGYSTNFMPFWADEFAVQPGSNQCLTYPNVGPGLGWMGDPIDVGPITTRWTQGLLRRRFRRRGDGKEVWVILNPKGNAQQSVVIPQTMKFLQGVQETTVNNGATITAGSSITIPVNEGRFLVQP